MRSGLIPLAALVAVCFSTGAKALDLADDLVISGYLDVRGVVAADPQSWLTGGLGKFRYGGKQKFGTEGVLQAELSRTRISISSACCAPSRKPPA